MKSHWLVGLGTLATSCVVAWGVQARLASLRSGDAGRTVMYYQDPMHPAYRSNAPGTAPDCGMALVPVFDDDVAGRSERTGDPGDLGVDASRLAALNMTLERVERSRSPQTLRSLGRVAPDDNRVFAVTAGGDGWVTRTFPGTSTGDAVRKGQPLAAVYGREFTTAERAFLFALRARENPPPAAPGDEPDATAIALEEARLSLRNIGVGEAQLRQLVETRRVLTEVTLTAPADGVIVGRAAIPNARFDRGAELFRIADVSRVWILAEVFAEDAALVPSGTRAAVRLPERPGAALAAAVVPASPRFDAGSRMVQVRLEAANPGRVLTPERIVDLEFELRPALAMTVPDAAVVADGEITRVFVVHGDRRVEARTVRTGWRRGGRVEIASGLEEGDTVVVSGAFLLESERRLRQRHD